MRAKIYGRMKNLSSAGLALALALFVTAATSALTAFHFTGTVTDDPFGLTKVGAPIPGSYSFNSVAVDAIADPCSASYASTGAELRRRARDAAQPDHPAHRQAADLHRPGVECLGAAVNVAGCRGVASCIFCKWCSMPGLAATPSLPNRDQRVRISSHIPFMLSWPRSIDGHGASLHSLN